MCTQRSDKTPDQIARTAAWGEELRILGARGQARSDQWHHRQRQLLLAAAPEAPEAATLPSLAPDLPHDLEKIGPALSVSAEF